MKTPSPWLDPWSEKWEFVRGLSGGGQGDTAIVKSLNTPSRQGVLKRLRPEKEEDEKARRRMYQEVSNLKILHSAGAKVPEVFDHNTAAFEGFERLFFVMEFIEGKTLSETISEQTLDVATAVRVAMELCKTLVYAVKEGIVHRDIKPENIIVRSLSPADVVMVDFGLARSEAESQNVTEIGETFDNKFLSLPERRGPDENKRDSRSDLTGLCAILLYCLTRCVPRDLRDSSNRPPHRLPSFVLDKFVENEVQRALLNAFFDRAFNWELDSRFQALDEIVLRLSEVMYPTASVLDEDLSAVAARESALLRKFDRKTQLADFRQAVYNADAEWSEHLNLVGKKLTTPGLTRFYISKTQNKPNFDFEKQTFGDYVDSFVAQLHLNNHNEAKMFGYHICSSGEDCIVVKQIYDQTTQGNTLPFVPSGDPILVTRYTGSGAIPMKVILKDLDSTIAKSMAELRAKVTETKSGGC